MAIAVASALVCPSWRHVGLYAHCPLLNRLVYPFFHAGLLHAALNVWCLLIVVFYYGTRLPFLALAWLAAASVPSLFVGPSPVVGISGIVFFLFGTLSCFVARKAYWQKWMAFYLVCGFLLPKVSGAVHLWCYAWGTLVSLLCALAERRRNG